MAIGPTEFLVYEISKATISAIVKPIISSTFKSLRSLSSTVIESFEDRFSDYILTQAERHSCLNTIVFGHQKSIEELYIPLTLVPANSTNEKTDEEIYIDCFYTKLLPSEKRVLITDTAGMGKSTISKFLFLQSLKSNYGIPIFLELRHLSSQNSILDLIQKQLNTTAITSDEPKFNKRQVERVFKKGGLIIFFDGYDEVPFKDREIITEDIKRFIEIYPDNIFVITSRPESGLLAFPTFKQYSIKSLKKEESFSLIRKYDQNGERAEQLISKLNGKDFVAVEEFLKNPLLTSLLYRSFDYKQNVPIKKHLFYRQVFDALFDWHDSSKDGYNTREKKSGLDIDAFHRMLRIIGFISVMNGKIEGDTDTILSWIRKARDICSNLIFSESSFLDDLTRAVPIFVKDGDYYRWSHKSLAEYFAAQYICTDGKAQQEKILSAIVSQERIDRFSNVLDQIYDVDVIAFRTHLILPLVRDFAKFWNSTYQGINPEVSAASIRLRKEASFDRNLFVLPFSEKLILDIQNELPLAINRFSGPPIDLKRSDIHFNFYTGNSTKPMNRTLLFISGVYTQILAILANKKDPLIKRKESIDLNTSVKIAPNFPPKLQLTDNSNSIENQPNVFDQYTNLFINRFILIDSEKALSFEGSFRDSVKIAELTDELLTK